MTTVSRALARAVEPPETANADGLAAPLLPPALRACLRAPKLVAWLSEWSTPGGIGYFNARTRHLDAVLAAEARAGLGQLVIVASGFDTRALRFSHALADARVFEVDLPASLAAKRRRLEALGSPRSAPVTFVPADLEVDSLTDRLRASGFDPGLRTLFIAEGLTYYLLADEVRALIHSIAECACPESGFVFDYTTEAFFLGDHSSYGSAQLAKSWKAMGDLHRSGVADVSALLHAPGFDVLSDLDAADLERTYHTTSTGTTRRVWGCFRIVHARRA